MQERWVLRLLVILLILLCVLFNCQNHEQIPSIRALQRMLMVEGYNCGDNAPDGVIGGSTLTAYRHYDKYNCKGE